MSNWPFIKSFAHLIQASFWNWVWCQEDGLSLARAAKTHCWWWRMQHYEVCHNLLRMFGEDSDWSHIRFISLRPKCMTTSPYIVPITDQHVIKVLVVSCTWLIPGVYICIVKEGNNVCSRRIQSKRDHSLKLPCYKASEPLGSKQCDMHSAACSSNKWRASSLKTGETAVMLILGKESNYLFKVS